MPVFPDSAPGRDALPVTAQRRLIVTRAALVLAEAAGIGLLAWGLDARSPLAALGLIVTLHAMLNAVAIWRLRAGGGATPEVLLHLAVDAAVIAALVYLTGGFANPFISLLLVPLILAAVSLPAPHAWGMAAWVGALYTLLMRYYVPLDIPVSSADAVDLHLTGMWLNFLLTAALVAAFAGRLAATLRRRDAELAEARERRLRDEHLFALGLQAASAAHDLATPLASARIALDELRRDYAGDDELDPSLTLLSGQLSRMENVLARLARSARNREHGAPPERVADWLAGVLEHWALMWPRVRVKLEVPADLPDIRTHAALEAALVTLLNNAAQAGAAEVEVGAGLAGERVVLQVADRGAGLDVEGRTPGWGVGLDLARAGLERLGGGLEVAPRAGGGVVSSIRIPVREAGA
jgi:two-component system sensor histidine kinase RegB